jgi:hypothetical protein
MTIKALDGTAVLRHIGGCGKPAVYLISETKPNASHTAYCEVHGRQVAERYCMMLLPAKETASRSRPRAIA